MKRAKAGRWGGMVFFCLFFLLFSGSGFSRAGQCGLISRTLPNGLTILAQEDHSAPVVAIQYWVKAGSRTERDREAGITHLIEHMIFKGTPTRAVGEVAREVESAGGEINAYTSMDYTVYHVTIASRYAEVGLEVLTDAVFNAVFDAEELEREKQVVLEELSMREDRPVGKLQKALFAAAYERHPYRRPVIGYRKTVSAFTREDLMDYVRRLYVPGNVVLVIVGDMDARRMINKVEETLGRRPARPSQIPLIPHEEPPREEPRAVILRETAAEAHLQLGFSIPSVRHEDIPALDLLAVILGGGESSRLERHVRARRELVYTIGAYAYTPVDPGLFLIQASLDPAKLHSTINEIFRQLARVRFEGVRKEELEKARINVEADFVMDKETMQGKARTLGYFQTVFGDPCREAVYLRAVRSVTLEDLRRVAETYLTPQRLTAAVLLPEDARVRVDPETIREAARILTRPPEPSTGDSREQGGASGEVHREVLKNGLTVLIKTDRTVPTVSLQGVFLGGQRFEDRRKAGISAFVARMLTKGTTSRTAEELAQEVESLAGSLSGYSGRNSLGLQAEFLSRFFPRAVELFADVLRNPTFDPEEMEKERKRVLAAVRREKDNPARMAFRVFAETLFRVHPYGLRRLGTERSLNSITREDLIAFYRSFILPTNGVIAIVGDVDYREALRWVRRYLGDWTGEPFSPPRVPQEPPLTSVRLVRKDNPNKQQAHVVLGFPGTRIGHPDQYPLEVLDTILSGQGGRLFRKLRDQEGLAYTVTSFSRVGLDPGYFGTYIATSPRNLQRAIEGLQRELERVSRQEVTREELERAKRYIVGTYEIGLQTHAAQAMTMALDERYGLGFDYGKRYIQRIQKVTAEDVLRVAKAYIDLDRYVLVVVGPDVEERFSLGLPARIRAGGSTVSVLAADRMAP